MRVLSGSGHRARLLGLTSQAQVLHETTKIDANEIILVAENVKNFISNYAFIATVGIFWNLIKNILVAKPFVEFIT